MIYSVAAFKDPGYVKTNLFKLDTENVMKFVIIKIIESN